MKQEFLTIEGIETYLSNLSRTNKMIAYMTPVILIGLFIFSLVIPYQVDQTDILVQESSNLQSSLTSKRLTKLSSKIYENDNQILSLKDEINQQKDNVHYLTAKLSQIKHTSFDQQNWTTILDMLLKHSVDSNLEINYIKNKDIESSRQSDPIQPVKEVQIEGIGRYQDIISLVTLIENIQMLIVFSKIKLTDQDENSVNFTLHFTIYKVAL